MGSIGVSFHTKKVGGKSGFPNNTFSYGVRYLSMFLADFSRLMKSKAHDALFE
jgi:hypothetical protein